MSNMSDPFISHPLLIKFDVSAVQYPQNQHKYQERAKRIDENFEVKYVSMPYTFTGPLWSEDVVKEEIKSIRKEKIENVVPGSGDHNQLYILDKCCSVLCLGVYKIHNDRNTSNAAI